MSGNLERSLEEWMEQYARSPPGIEDEEWAAEVAANTRRILSWWQQEDKPWRGHDAKKNANEVALEAILRVFTVGTSELSDEEWMKRYG